MPAPGLLFVVSKVIDPSKTPDEQYNKWYDEEHLGDVLGTGVPKLGLRYKNINPKSDMPYLAAYPVPDSQWIFSDDLQKLKERTRHTPYFNNEDRNKYISFTSRPYEKIQTFEGFEQAERPGNETRGTTIVAVAMEPAAGQDEDFDAWYRLQHLDMLSMCRGYRRSTRYKRMDGKSPRFLALHEYACEPEELPADQIKILSSTEWSKKILGSVQAFDRDVFKLITVQGDEKAKL